MANKHSPIGRILTVLKMERQEITSVYFYAILNGLIQLSLPLGVQAIVGFALGASIRASLILLVILVVLGVLLSGIMQVSQMKIIEKIQQKLFVRYAFAFIKHIPRLDLKKTDNVHLPELLNRFFDVPILQKSLAKILLDIPTASIQILFGLALLSFYHPAFIFFGLVLLTVLFLILRYTGQQGLETSIQESNHKYKTAAWLQETARIIKSIKLAKKNDLHIQKLDTAVSNYLDARNSHFGILLVQYNILVIFKTVVTAAMLIVGSYLMVNQLMSVGQFVAAEIVIIMVLNSVEKLIISLASVYDTLTAQEKIAYITDKPVEHDGQVNLQPDGKGLKVEFRNLSFSYNNVYNIINNTSICIEANEKVCITGSESSGKSTLLKLISGVYPDFTGIYLLNDIPLGNYKLDSIRNQTGIVIGQQEIFHGTLWENITLGNKAISMETVTDYAMKVGLSEFVSTLHSGYDTVLDPTGSRLPRSVVAKILLVRALASRPRMLLLEEPWLYCDTHQRKHIIDILLALKSTTVIVVSNDEEFASQCDQVIILNNNGSVNASVKNG